MVGCTSRLRRDGPGRRASLGGGCGTQGGKAPFQPTGVRPDGHERFSAHPLGEITLSATIWALLAASGLIMGLGFAMSAIGMPITGRVGDH
jgi:hypothetical protein